MAVKSYKFKSKIWLWPGETAAWHFVTVDKKQSAEIKEKHAIKKRGFGSVPVTVTIGKTTWKTSIFPDSKSGCYVLPLKAKVRQVEGLFEGDQVSVKIEPNKT